MSTSVEQIKERLSVDEVVGKYIKLERAGANLKARCPFHNEKTPSFFVSPARGSFYCFGCGAKGDIFSFVEQFEGIDFKGALRVLANMAGVVLKEENPKERSERDSLFALMNDAALFYERNLPASSEAKEYLRVRGLTEATIKEWRIGFALPDWRTLYEHLRRKGVSEDLMRKAGLIKEPSRAGDSPYDTFRGRIMFPLFDPSGRVVAFSGRILPRLDDGKTAKYLNSPDTALWSKTRTLYGYDRAKLAIRMKDYSILVEGQMDLLMAHQAGYKNTVATSGTALTPEHLANLRRLSGNLLMAFDADKAGLSATERGYRLALRQGFAVKVAKLPEGSDPADLILTDAEGWKAALKGSKFIVDAYIERLESEKLGAREAAKRFKEKILPLLASIQSPAEQSRLISAHKLSILTGIREDALWEELKKFPAEESFPETVGLKKDAVSSYFLERKALGIIFFEEARKADTGEHRKRFKELMGTKAEEIERAVGPMKEELIFEADVSYTSHEKRMAALNEFFLRLEEEYLKQEFGHVMQELYKAEQGKDQREIDVLLKKCQELGGRISKLKSSPLM